MKNILKNNRFVLTPAIFLIFLGSILFVCLRFYPRNILSNKIEQTYNGSPLFFSGDVTCTYPQTIGGLYNQEKITYEIYPPEKNALIFTFSNMEEQIAKLKYIDSTQTISEVSLLKVADNNEKIVFIEIGENYTTLHTIFKKSGISMYSKQSSLIGIPIGTTAIGTCIDS